MFIFTKTMLLSLVPQFLYWTVRCADSGGHGKWSVSGHQVGLLPRLIGIKQQQSK